MLEDVELANKQMLRSRLCTEVRSRANTEFYEMLSTATDTEVRELYSTRSTVERVRTEIFHISSDLSQAPEVPKDRNAAESWTQSQAVSIDWQASQATRREMRPTKSLPTVLTGRPRGWSGMSGAMSRTGTEFHHLTPM